jgi:lipoprotein-anchoring transpeptidase ErfK/SrfK
MKHLWVYGVSFLMTALGIGGTLFFFMKAPTENTSVSTEAPTEMVQEVGTAEANSAVSSPSSPSIQGNDRFAQAQQLKAEGNFVQAREILKEMIQSQNQVPHLDLVEKEYWDTNIKLLFSSQPLEGWTQDVVVQKGDSLFSIANQFHTTIDLLSESNQLRNAVIHPGQTLRVLTGEISILVDKSLNTLTLKVNGEVLKVYNVGTGVEGSTPVGDFKIINKLENPPWHHEGKIVPFGDPENILGTRWMGFDLKGYGIHGTWDPGSVGSQSSAGCVRLKNEEVEELYKIVPVGTMVAVVE